MPGEDILEWRGCEVIDADGDRVGKLTEIYLDADTRRPEWAFVGTGLFKRRTTIVPLKGAERQGDYVRVPFQKDQIKGAPDVDADGQLTQAEEERVYRHYGLDYARDHAAPTESGGNR